MIEKSDSRSRHLQTILRDPPVEESHDVDQIEQINKRDYYRVLKRKRDAKDISQYNLSFQRKESPTLRKDTQNNDSTGLLWFVTE